MTDDTKPISPPFDAKRIVRPRKNNDQNYSIIALHEQTCVTETLEIHSREWLYTHLFSAGPTVVATQSSANFLADIHDCYSGLESWQWKCSSREREVYTAQEDVEIVQADTIVHFFGWQDKKRKRNRYHLALDPVIFYGRSLHEIDTRATVTPLYKLFAWAVRLRNWCNDNQITVRPTAGALGGQLLRDRRFYACARRKIPAATNASAREHLPGNHYELRAPRDKETTGIYLDQTRAHHYHAIHTRLPDANSLYAYGDFQERKTPSFGPELLESGFSGLICGWLERSTKHARSVFDPFNSTQAPRYWLTSEWPYLRDRGYSCSEIIAAWGSTDEDTGIKKYAQWACNELDKEKDAPWLKPILLSTYGVLASKPRVIQFTFNRAAKGRQHTLFAGNRKLAGLLVGGTSGRRIEPGICNVLHRALIESATRSESVGFAEYLTWKGYYVLCIYADAVIVKADETLPDLSDVILPDPWRIKDTLHHLRFINQQAFVSGEMTKLPGVSGREAVKAGMGRVGKAPMLPKYEALTGRRV